MPHSTTLGLGVFIVFSFKGSNNTHVHVLLAGIGLAWVSENIPRCQGCARTVFLLSSHACSIYDFRYCINVMGDSHGRTDDTRSHPLTSVIKFGGPSRKKQTIFLFADKKKISILQQISTITSVFLSLFELFVKKTMNT